MSLPNTEGDRNNCEDCGRFYWEVGMRSCCHRMDGKLVDPKGIEDCWVEGTQET